MGRALAIGQFNMRPRTMQLPRLGSPAGCRGSHGEAQPASRRLAAFRTACVGRRQPRAPLSISSGRARAIGHSNLRTRAPAHAMQLLQLRGT